MTEKMLKCHTEFKVKALFCFYVFYVFLFAFSFLNLSIVPKLKRELDCENVLPSTIFYPTRASMTGCLWTTPTPSPSTWPKCFKREGSRCHFQILQAKVFHKSTSWQAKGTISEYFAIPSTWNVDFNNFQNARILQCKWRGGANDQEVVQVSMKNLTGLQVPKTKFTFELQMFGAKTYSETRKTKEEPFVENWMETTLALRFMLKSRPSQAKIHTIITSGRRSLHKSKKLNS